MPYLEVDAVIETLAKLVEAFGIPLAMVGLLSWFLIWMAKSHKAERKEWREDQTNLQTESNRVMRELTSVISESNIRHDARNN